MTELNDDASNVQVQEEMNDLKLTDNDHKSLYKSIKQPLTAQERRERMLEDIRRRRHKIIDDKREIEEEVYDETADCDMNASIDEENSELMDETESTEVNNKKYHRRRIRYCVMGSEWMREVPQDLEQNWLVKICPKGKRILVIAQDKNTMALDRLGRLVAEFPSFLPGGNKTYQYNRRTILDCIYVHSSKTYYVLDVLMWNNMSCIKFPTDYRFSYLQVSLGDTALQTTSSLNTIPFREVPYITGELSQIQSVLSQPFKIADANVDVDGVLFFHREMPYLKKVTPLVCWLKPYMIPEILKLPVHESFMKTPANYTNFMDYMNYIDKLREEKYLKIQQKRKQKKDKKRMQQEAEETMECEEAGVEGGGEEINDMQS